jgi:DNA-binding Lrp family transcriptional regulator
VDGYDKRLLAALQENADRTAEQLGEEIALSASAIQRRIRRLKESGVIERLIAVAQPRQVGSPSHFVVNLQVERERPELLAQLRRWLADEPLVQQAYYVTGEADFILVVAAPDAMSYDELMSRLMAENPNVRRFTTSVALGIVKRGLSLPMPLDG